MKYHLTDKGEAKKCSAKPGNCPVTRVTEGEHYDSVEQAQGAYEKSQSTFGAKTLGSTVDAQKFRGFIKSGHISERVHPEDESLKVYSYTPKTQFSGMWTPETLLARGLILKSSKTGDFGDSTIHARALGKFFTVEQMSEGDWTNIKLVDDDENVTIQENAPIDFAAPATVAEKMNGALGVTYIDSKGNASISTKGSFSSVEAQIGTKILEKYDQKKLGDFIEKNMPNSTPLFEIISPDRPHPVDYGDMEDVILLGSVNKSTGRWTPIHKDDKIVKEFCFKTAEEMPATTLGEALATPYKKNTEGMVVTTTSADGQQKMYKVKPVEYHNLRSAFYKLKKGKVSETVTYVTNDDLMAVEKPEDIKLDLDANAKQFESFAQGKLFKEYVEPTKSLVDQTNADFDEFLRKNEVELNDPNLRRIIGTTKEKNLPTTKNLLFAVLKDRTDQPGFLLESAKNSIIKKLK